MRKFTAVQFVDEYGDRIKSLRGSIELEDFLDRLMLDGVILDYKLQDPLMILLDYEFICFYHHGEIEIVNGALA